MYGPLFCTHPSAEGHLGRFHILAMVNHTPMNTYKYFFKTQNLFLTNGSLHLQDQRASEEFMESTVKQAPTPGAGVVLGPWH